MPAPSVIVLTVRQNRRALLGWLLGITAMTALYTPVTRALPARKRLRSTDIQMR